MQTCLHVGPHDHLRARDGRAGTGRNLSRLSLLKLGRFALVGGLALGLASVGCARVNTDGSGGTGLPGGTGGVWGTGASPVSVGHAGQGGMAPPVFIVDAGQPEMVACDGGDACMCPPFQLAVIGKPGKWGANPNGDPDTALQDWLNSNSAGTAQVDNFPSRPTLTPDFLGKYSVIILAGLAEDSNNGPWWTFSADEIAAFRAWVENGGGVITLSGYSGDSSEITPVNQLIEFSGVTYGRDTVSGSCAEAQTCNCTHCNTLSDWNRTDPVVAPLATGMTFVGLASGRSIIASGDSHVAATAGGNNKALVGKVVGKGRVLVYTDEWVTYTSQWTGAGIPNATDPNCAGYLPQDKYQIPQFWYNLIRWVQPAAECFRIVGPNIIG